MTNSAAVVADVFDSNKNLSPAGLHRATAKALNDSHFIVFDRLPNLIEKVIANKTWRAFGHKSFADYALDSTSDGLGVNTNTRLWILRCAMDVHGEHIGEWADVLSKVEAMVQQWAKVEGRSISSFQSNSLEKLAKDRTLQHTITYMPSRSSGSGVDRQLSKIGQHDKSLIKKVADGTLTVTQALKKIGVIRPNSHFKQAQYRFAMLSAAERRQFLAWLKDQGHL